jgi:DNA-binding XRE family transcriptional regulator
MGKRVDWDKVLDVRRLRAELGLSQTELAQLLGVSPRVIQSCEQGWRRPSAAVQRSMLLLLLAARNGSRLGHEACWEVVRCRPAVREACLIGRCKLGHLCWLLTGNACRGKSVKTWRAKQEVCGECAFLQKLLAGGGAPAKAAAPAR